MKEPAFGILWLSFCALLFIGPRYVRRIIVAVAAGTIVVLGTFALDATPRALAAVLASALLLLVVAFLVWGELRVIRRVRAWRAEAADAPLVLRSPFARRWRVAAGGPYPALNHHLVASDQRFAYDFVREWGQSFGQPILAPCDGTVVACADGLEDHDGVWDPDRQPDARGESALGNFVAIDSGRGVVFLCHLQQGSVRVAVGQGVMSGTPIGRCGNSGRTTRPHLHLHAQREPVPALGSGTGVPVAFVNRAGVPRVLGAEAVLAGTPALEPTATATGL